jgi:hypothetical protein
MVHFLVISCLLATALSVNAQQERALGFNIQTCTGSKVCKSEAAKIVLDKNWGGNYQGISTNGNALTMSMKFGGSRNYLATADGNSYRTLNLLNREFTFDVDMSRTDCGVNGALYFVAMPNQGANQGAGYCDGANGQSNKCLEIDLWEANSKANVFTTHPCAASKTECDGNGCGFNTYANGDHSFYGKGSNFKVDTSKPFTVVTRFLTNNNADNGQLKEIQRFYVQNGKVINNSAVQGYSSISDNYCTNYAKNTYHQKLGGLAGMTKTVSGGMTLAISLWTGNMDWLNSGNNGPCGAGAQNKDPSQQVVFSNIRFGTIGSTA